MVCTTLEIQHDVWAAAPLSTNDNFNGFVQDCSNSSALAMELLQPCTKPSICTSAIGKRWQIPTFLSAEYKTICIYVNSSFEFENIDIYTIRASIPKCLAPIAIMLNNRDAGDLRRHRTHYDVIVVKMASFLTTRSAGMIKLFHRNEAIFSLWT